MDTPKKNVNPLAGLERRNKLNRLGALVNGVKATQGQILKLQDAARKEVIEIYKALNAINGLSQKDLEETVASLTPEKVNKILSEIESQGSGTSTVFDKNDATLLDLAKKIRAAEENLLEIKKRAEDQMRALGMPLENEEGGESKTA